MRTLSKMLAVYDPRTGKSTLVGLDAEARGAKTWPADLDRNWYARNADKVVPVNFRIKTGRVVPYAPCEKFDNAGRCLAALREYLEAEVGTGTDLCGWCVEASELLVTLLGLAGIENARTVEGWCRFDNDWYGSDRPYDPHTWVSVPAASLGLQETGNCYLDATADQFNPGMYPENEYPPYVIRLGLPHGICLDEPTEDEGDDEN